MMQTRRRFLTAGVALGTVVSSGARRPARAQAAPAIAAASDLKFALDEIAARFHAETGHAVKLSFGSSGNFTAQLMQGAPFEMFLSADEGFVRRLADAGRTVDRGVLYAEGRIVLFAPEGSPLAPDARFAGLRAALKDGHIRRFAIANPEHAPYGQAARQALEGQGLWEAVFPRLVLGENVAQAAQFATSGSTQGGIFALSLALTPQVSALGRHALIPADWHAPLRQRMVLLRSAGDIARSFYAYLQSPASRAMLRRYGFVVPGQAA